MGSDLTRRTEFAFEHSEKPAMGERAPPRIRVVTRHALMGLPGVVVRDSMARIDGVSSFRWGLAAVENMDRAVYANLSQLHAGGVLVPVDAVFKLLGYVGEHAAILGIFGGVVGHGIPHTAVALL